MNTLLGSLLLICLLVAGGPAPLYAQDPGDSGDESSQQVEESDEAFRRRMELEDARQRDLGYTPPPPTYAEKQEKINKLPEASRDNIREQLVDMIVENGDWEPADALEERPYEPTVAALADPELMQQEQEAWDEQIAKYNRREAAAYAALRGPQPGPGNPTGEEGGGPQGSEADGSEQDSGQAGGSPGSPDEGQDKGQEQDSGQAADQAGTYQPYQSNRGASDDAVSTAGVQQSALDFLKGLQGQASTQTTASAGAPQASAQSSGQNQPQSAEQAASAEQAPSAEQVASAEQSAEASDEQSNEQASQDAAKKKAVEIDLSTPGIIAIRDLDKLEVPENPDPPP